MQPDLFDAPAGTVLSLGEGTVLLRGRATAGELLPALASVLQQAPLRHMHTPGGRLMGVAMSNCGDCGWVSDAAGYRYESHDPQSGQPWPALPDCILQLAQKAAADAGFDGFVPDACLINHYEPGVRLSLHQDRDERDFSAPIVSVSLGLPVWFLLGGLRRSDPVSRVLLQHEDVLVWGGPDRLRFHGVMPLQAGWHPVVGRCRYNLTLRRAR